MVAGVNFPAPPEVGGITAAGARRRISRAHGPRRPVEEPCTWAGCYLGARQAGGPRGGVGQRPGPGGGERGGRLGHRAQAQAGGGRGQQHLGGPGVAQRGRVELVVGEVVPAAGELRAEDVAQADRPAAGGHHRHRLGRGQRAGQPAGQPAQRLGDRPDGAEVGAGADHQRQVLLGQQGQCGVEVPDRLGGPDPVGDVVGPDHDHREVRALRQHQLDLVRQRRALGAHHRDVAQPDRAPGQCRQAQRDLGSRRLDVGVHPVAGGRRVAEHRQHQRRRAGRHPGRRPHPVGPRRVGLGGLDPAAGQLRLAVQHAVHRRADRAQAARPESGSGRHPARPRSPAHATAPRIYWSVLPNG